MRNRVPIRLPAALRVWAFLVLPLLILAAIAAFLPFATRATAALPAADRPGAVTPVTPSFVQIVADPTGITRPVGAGVDPAFNRIYISHNGTGSGLVTLDGNTNVVNGVFGGLSSGQDLSVNRTSHKVFVGNDGNTFVTVYDASNPSSFNQINVGNIAPFGSVSYEAAARTYVFVHQAGKLVTLDSTFGGIVSTDADWQGHAPGNPLLGAVDPGASSGPRLYVTHFNGEWGLFSLDIANPSQPRLVYILQYDTCGRVQADTLGVAVNPSTHEIFATYNGPSSACNGLNSGYVARWDQFGNNQVRYEFPNASVGNLIYIPETNRIWVIQKQDGFAYVFDAGSMALIAGPLQVGTAGFPGGTGPERGITYNPNTGYVYITSLRSNEVTVFRDFLVTSGNATPTPTFTAGPAATATATSTPQPTFTPTPLPLCPSGGTQPTSLARRLFMPFISGGDCRP